MNDLFYKISVRGKKLKIPIRSFQSTRAQLKKVLLG